MSGSLLTLDSGPESRDGGFVLVQRDSEACLYRKHSITAAMAAVRTVNLLLVLHDEEGVIVEITEELDVGPRTTSAHIGGISIKANSLDAPVVLVLIKKRVTEEELKGIRVGGYST